MEKILKQVLLEYGFYPENCTLQKTGNGLINHTFLLSTSDKKYIVQEINSAVFKSPGMIDENISAIGKYLHANFPDYYFTMPIKALSGKTQVNIENHFYRLFEFVKDPTTFSVVTAPDIAFEAAKQFGRFTKLLKDFPTEILHETIPHFHDLILRQKQFEQSLKSGKPERIEKAKNLIADIVSFNWITETFEKNIHNKAFKKRVTHHDTKISNVLFNNENKGICVIDLDTIMPGYFFSDVGDMMRTYLSPAGEEERNLDKIEVRDDYFNAIADGYLSEMQEEMNDAEIHAFYFSGQVMIYMQALRFLTDYLNGDIYYTAKDALHNFYRAGNQLQLLKIYSEKKTLYENRIQILLTKKHFAG
ncbi:MAG: aminoglycoside phosphotransferase family protein [Chitinophagaceae bacterium]